MSFKFLLIGVLSAGAQFNAGSSAKAKPSAESVAKVFAELRKADGVRADIKKVVEQKVLERTVESSGLFYFSKGKMRLEISKPEPSLLVFDGSHVWLESTFDEDTKQVTKIFAGNLRKSDSMMASLFDRDDVLKKFKLIGVADHEGLRKFSFVPKNPKSTEVKSLDIELQGNKLKSLAYADQIENVVRYEFETLSVRKLSNGLFLYKPPNGATVSEIR